MGKGEKYPKAMVYINRWQTSMSAPECANINTRSKDMGAAYSPRTRIPTGWEFTKNIRRRPKVPVDTESKVPVDTESKVSVDTESKVPVDTGPKVPEGCVHPASVSSALTDALGFCYYIEFSISQKAAQELQDSETPSGSQHEPLPGGSSSKGPGESAVVQPS